VPHNSSDQPPLVFFAVGLVLCLGTDFGCQHFWNVDHVGHVLRSQSFAWMYARHTLCMLIADPAKPFAPTVSKELEPLHYELAGKVGVCSKTSSTTVLNAHSGDSRTVVAIVVG
jgi:hypothetical protein